MTTKDSVMRITLKPGCYGRVSSYCSTCSTRRVTLVTMYKPGDKSSMRKGPDCNYDKQNSSMVICDTDTQ